MSNNLDINMLHAGIYRVITMCADMRTIRKLQSASREFRLDAARQYMVRIRNRRIFRDYDVTTSMIGADMRDGPYAAALGGRIMGGYYVCNKRHGVYIYTWLKLHTIVLYDHGTEMERYEWYADRTGEYCCISEVYPDKYSDVIMTFSEVLQWLRARYVQCT